MLKGYYLFNCPGREGLCQGTTTRNVVSSQVVEIGFDERPNTYLPMYVLSIAACCLSIHCIGHKNVNVQRQVNKHIGREPSGRPVNELILDRRTDPAVPHNPFVNAGSIMSCALVQPQLGNAEARVQYCIGQYWNRLSGNRRAWTWDRDNYEMESATADRNRCLMYASHCTCMCCVFESFVLCPNSRRQVLTWHSLP